MGNLISGGGSLKETKREVSYYRAPPVIPGELRGHARSIVTNHYNYEIIGRQKSQIGSQVGEPALRMGSG
jgi:hypothetical protein